MAGKSSSEIAKTGRATIARPIKKVRLSMIKRMIFPFAGILMLFAGVQMTSAQDMAINGAGATFPAPLYLKWAYNYNQINPNLKFNYQSLGSGAGIQQIKNKTVDFGASDAPLKKADLDSFGMIQFPMVMGGDVPIVNLTGVKPGQLKLDGPTLAAIFMGQVTKWNDPAITALNSGLKLPDQEIAVVHRSDGSGTTWIFTTYLSAVSPEWKTKVGADKAVAWPTGTGGKGNEGVSVTVQQISGAIGYVEYAYASQNQMTYVQMKNHDGNFVSPNKESFMAAAANADWKNAPGFYMVLVDQPGKDSWPITGATFIIIYKNQTKADLGKAVLTFFDWCYTHGGDEALKLDYVPMPENVIKMVQAVWKDQVRSGGKPLWK
jgi:phosphate transport system substrate-binding protein